jgi:hypothetical protein
MESASEMGVSVTTLRVGSGHAGFKVENDEVIKEVQYLIGGGLAELCEKTVSPENRRWRITKAGRDHLAMQGLA